MINFYTQYRPWPASHPSAEASKQIQPLRLSLGGSASLLKAIHIHFYADNVHDYGDKNKIIGNLPKTKWPYVNTKGQFSTVTSGQFGNIVYSKFNIR